MLRQVSEPILTAVKSATGVQVCVIVGSSALRNYLPRQPEDLDLLTKPVLSKYLSRRSCENRYSGIGLTCEEIWRVSSPTIEQNIRSGNIFLEALFKLARAEPKDLRDIRLIRGDAEYLGDLRNDLTVYCQYFAMFRDSPRLWARIYRLIFSVTANPSVLQELLMKLKVAALLSDLRGSRLRSERTRLVPIHNGNFLNKMRTKLFSNFNNNCEHLNQKLPFPNSR